MKLATVIGDIMGWSGRAMLQALCDGKRDPEHLEVAHVMLRYHTRMITTTRDPSLLFG